MFSICLNLQFVKKENVTYDGIIVYSSYISYQHHRNKLGEDIVWISRYSPRFLWIININIGQPLWWFTAGMIDGLYHFPLYTQSILCTVFLVLVVSRIHRLTIELLFLSYFSLSFSLSVFISFSLSLSLSLTPLSLILSFSLTLFSLSLSLSLSLARSPSRSLSLLFSLSISLLL